MFRYVYPNPSLYLFQYVARFGLLNYLFQCAAFCFLFFARLQLVFLFSVWCFCFKPCFSASVSGSSSLFSVFCLAIVGISILCFLLLFQALFFASVSGISSLFLASVLRFCFSWLEFPFFT